MTSNQNMALWKHRLVPGALWFFVSCFFLQNCDSGAVAAAASAVQTVWRESQKSRSTQTISIGPFSTWRQGIHPYMGQLGSKGSKPSFKKSANLALLWLVLGWGQERHWKSQDKRQKRQRARYEESLALSYVDSFATNYCYDRECWQIISKKVWIRMKNDFLCVRKKGDSIIPPAPRRKTSCDSVIQMTF